MKSTNTDWFHASLALARSLRSCQTTHKSQTLRAPSFYRTLVKETQTEKEGDSRNAA
jgi:hypothetical protein